MKIQSAERESRLIAGMRRLWQPAPRRYAGLAMGAIALVYIGAYAEHKGVRISRAHRVVKSKIELIRARGLEVVANSAAGLVARPEEIRIHIKFKHLSKLEADRKRAMEAGFLAVSNEDYVPATIEHRGKRVPVKLRLKGDNLDHLEGRKWSYRVRMKDENTLFGMKQFSLQHPATRAYIHEWVYHQALRREQVLALRYDFVNVVVNGADLGIYALEEHFEKRLIENNGRREGPIVRFDESLLWDETFRQRKQFPWSMFNGVGSYTAANVDAFHSGKWTLDPQLREQHDKAVALLDAFRRGERKTSEVFDVEKLAAFFAISDLVGADHGTHWINARYYYNPITSRIEPIGFDGHTYVGNWPIKAVAYTRPLLWKKDNWFAYLDGGEYWETLFSDAEFLAAYLGKLEEVSKPEYLETFFGEIDDMLNDKLAILYKEFPTVRFSKDRLKRNQQYIRNVLSPVQAVAAYYVEPSGRSLQLRVASLQMIPSRVLEVRSGELSLSAPASDRLIPAKSVYDPLDFQTLTFTVPEGIELNDAFLNGLTLRCQLLGSQRTSSVAIGRWPYGSQALRGPDLARAEPNIHAFECLVVDDEEKTITILAGEWTIEEDLIIPPGHVVRCGEGTRLHLTRSAAIVTYSPLEFIGTQESPIVIDSPDKTGQGLLALNVKRGSTLRHVEFRDLTALSRPGWSLTGAATFYESPVAVFHCQFLDNSCEDGLNLVRSKFVIEESLFARTQSDAFDADFCEGRVVRSSFSDTGNDAIDVSGSVVEITDVHVRSAGDKAVSVGEKSLVECKNLLVNGAGIAVAIKDRSQFEATHVEVSGARIGIAAYQKKPEFGGGEGTIKGFELENVHCPYLIENGSKVAVDGRQIRSSHYKVADRLESAVH